MELQQFRDTHSLVNDQQLPPLVKGHSTTEANMSRNSVSPRLVVTKDNELGARNGDVVHKCEKGKLSVGTPDGVAGNKSRPSSDKWKAAANAVIASNTLMQLKTDAKLKPKFANPQRIMDGSDAHIPVLPLPLSVVFLLLNCIIPGLGTILSGFSLICCGTSYNEPDRGKLKGKIIGTVLVNCGVGLAQLFTTTFVLVGWFWSLSRGVTMVYLSLEARASYDGKTFENNIT